MVSFKPADAENLHDIHLVEGVEKGWKRHAQLTAAPSLPISQSGESTPLIWRELASANELPGVTEEQRS